jgi:hypothetical protein
MESPVIKLLFYFSCLIAAPIIMGIMWHNTDHPVMKPVVVVLTCIVLLLIWLVLPVRH